MLGAGLDHWMQSFRTSDRRMPFFDLEGRPRTYSELLRDAPASKVSIDARPEVIARRYEETQEAMKRLSADIAAADLDVLVIIGDDQHELFLDDHMPSIAIYYGETIRNASRASAAGRLAPEPWYAEAQATRLESEGDAHYPVDAELARFLIEGLIDKNFDVSAVAGLAEGQFEGHAYSFIHRRYLNETAVPIVPVFLNTYNPPNVPRPRRCAALGEALAELIALWPEDKRVGIIASGGLSHFICEERFDREIVAAMRDNNLDFLEALDPCALKGGSSEIRNWIVVAAAARKLELEWMEYLPVYRTPALSGIGLCFGTWKSSREG